MQHKAKKVKKTHEDTMKIREGMCIGLDARQLTRSAPAWHVWLVAARS